MQTKKAWADKLMIGFYKKEATYGAGVTMDATNACSLSGYKAQVEWGDTVVNDKEETTGTEFGTTSEIVEQRVKMTVSESNAKPNTLIGLAAMALGSVTATQDGALAAYSQKIIPATVGTVLPSTQAEATIAGIQRAYKGLKVDTLKIAANDRLVSVEAGLMGDGSRATSATAFVASLTESWLKLADCKVYLENGTAISISPTLVQAAEDISSGAPVDLSARIQGVEWNWNNKLEGQPGYGGAGLLQDLDYGKRETSLKFTLLFNDATEIDHYLNMDPLAIEFDLKGGLIAATGAMYYGFHLIVPRFKLLNAPLPKEENGIYVCEMECDIQDDGTNPAVIIEGYSSKPAYLA